MSKPQYYEHSGYFSPVLFVPALLVTLGASFFFAWLYALLIYYIPFIYINAFLTVGFAFAITMTIGLAMKGAKLRNNFLFGAVSLVVAVAAYVAHWAVWLGHLLRAGSDIEISALEIFLQPAVTWSVIVELNSVGAWSLLGIQVSGVFLALI